MKKTLSILFGILLAVAGRAQTIEITTSEPDAQIIVDGQVVGNGLAKIKVGKELCSNVKIVKKGFLVVTQVFCNKKGMAVPPKKKYFEMVKDDAEEASVKTDIANIDFSVTVNEKLDATEAWKLVSQIVTDYFDVIEVADKETSYLRTAWGIQTFKQAVIRTRLIIKLGKSNPLTYRIKLVSEYSNLVGASVKSDESFNQWDRILRKYENTISDFSNRLGSK